jgi:predicted lipid-binding transport protein (Tim44 family)
MATPDRENLYRTEDRVYTREGNGTGWFVGIIVALALIAIGYLIFAANSGPATTPVVDGTAPITTPADPAPMTDAAPMTGTTPAPAVEAPAATPEAAPSLETPVAPVDAAPAAEVPAQ